MNYLESSIFILYSWQNYATPSSTFQKGKSMPTPGLMALTNMNTQHLTNACVSVGKATCTCGLDNSYITITFIQSRKTGHSKRLATPGK